jgi:hypothetical protein
VDYWLSGKRNHLKLETVHSRFKFVTSLSQLYRLKEQVEAAGSRYDKLLRARLLAIAVTGVELINRHRYVC